MAYLAAHVGEGHYLLSAIDPSVVDERDPCELRSRASTCTTPRTASSSHRPRPATAPEFLARYRGGAARPVYARLDAEARRRRAIRRDARARRRRDGRTAARRKSIATDFLCVYRTDADPRGVDLSPRPVAAATYGSLWGVRPDWINYGAVGFGRVVAPEAWLSTWSGCSSRANILQTGARMTLPALMVSYTGDHGIYPSEHAAIAAALGTERLRASTSTPTTTAFPTRDGREPAIAAIAEWLASR